MGKYAVLLLQAVTLKCRYPYNASLT